jgi:lauroyl/myristoyl acyltransferase
MFTGDGPDRLHAAWEASSGVILAGLHIGNGEVAAAALAGRGWPVHYLADDTAYEELFERFVSQRRAWGVEVIRWRNLREVYRVLRRGEILGLLVDWGYRSDGEPVRLMGAWTTLPSGPAYLAGKTGATIVPFWTIRRADGTFVGEVGEPIRVTSTEPAEIARATQALATSLETCIREAPDQWCVFKPMWPDDRLSKPHCRPRRAGRGETVARGTPFQRIRAALVEALAAVLGHLPGSVGGGLSDAIGELWYRLAPDRAAVARGNLAHVASWLAAEGRGSARARAAAADPAALERLVRAAFRHVVRTYAETLRGPATARDVRAHLVVDDPERVDAAFAVPGPNVFATLHFGSMVAVSTVLTDRIRVPITAPMETPR